MSARPAQPDCARRAAAMTKAEPGGDAAGGGGHPEFIAGQRREMEPGLRATSLDKGEKFGEDDTAGLLGPNLELQD